jgi:hypothetical protein
MPSPAAPFEPRFCIQQAGAIASCPAPFSDGPRVYYVGPTTDSRTCSACACGAAGGAQCGLPIPPGFRYLDLACSTPTSPFAVPTICAAYTGIVPLKLVGGPTLTAAGTCAPTGGKPEGTVTPTAATTFCCTP